MESEWLWGFGGGLLIGAAAAMFLLVNGRIMGASGILGGLVDGSGWSSAAERIALIGGLVTVPGLLSLAIPSDTHSTSNLTILIAGGLLVGIGTRLANGCTSGHGVCGMSRLSPRGIVATLIYLAAGVVVMLLFRHGLGVI